MPAVAQDGVLPEIKLPTLVRLGILYEDAVSIAVDNRVVCRDRPRDVLEKET